MESLQTWVFPQRGDMQLALHFNAVLMAFHLEKQRHVNFPALLDVYIVKGPAPCGCLQLLTN
ncbi:unnamed protein product [Leuciscus chuanchicus]